MRLIGTMGSHSADRSDTRLKQFDVEGPHPMYAYVLHRGVGVTYCVVYFVLVF